jgi:DNA-binding PadR family transcriptional regulator
MSDEPTAGQKARTDDDVPHLEKPAAPDGGTAATNGSGPHRIPEFSGFRRDILLLLALSEPTNGRGLLDDLSSLRDEDVNGGRLYPNLNALVDKGLVEKRENYHDDRSHQFRLADRGCQCLREHAQRLSGAVNALEETTEAER